MRESRACRVEVYSGVRYERNEKRSYENWCIISGLDLVQILILIYSVRVIKIGECGGVEVLRGIG